ncbi:MAG TPA: LptA/OstA family protein [Acetobacteraceae bacterium]
MRRLVLALLLLGPAVPAQAQAIDMSHGGPVEVTASDGMEWRQNEQVVIARGSARAVRGDVTVTADQLIAHYRKKAGAAAATPAAAKPGLAGADTGSNEIYRLEAEGNVHIFTATDLAVADRAVYDIDQSVLLLTGSALKITTPQQVMTARDAMEYWSAKRMAVGRGLATVTTSDGRRVSADTLVAYTTPPDQQLPGPKLAAVPAKPGTDPLTASGKLERVEGFGNVEVRTATEIIHADRGVYVPDTGIARLAGNVHLTRGQNQLNGDEAVVNMHTGISTLSKNPGGRIQGLVVPNDATGAAPGAKSKP